MFESTAQLSLQYKKKQILQKGKPPLFFRNEGYNIMLLTEFAEPSNEIKAFDVLLRNNDQIINFHFFRATSRLS